MACPRCGHQQAESPSAYSTICRKCGAHFRIEEVLKPARPVPDRTPRHRKVTCFECGAELDVPASAESSMCKWCSRYLDLHSYRITNAVAKNFKTKGALVIEPKGWVFNTESVAGEVVIKGKFHGKLTAEQSLTIHTGADIKGILVVAHLILPAGQSFCRDGALKTGSAEIAGEWVGSLHAAGSVILKSTARWFGDLAALKLVIEPGAVIEGKLKIGFPARSPQPMLL